MPQLAQTAADFDKTTKRLAEITSALEKAESVQEAVDLYAEGVRLERELRQMLMSLEMDVKVMTQDGQVKTFDEKGPQK